MGEHEGHNHSHGHDHDHGHSHHISGVKGINLAIVVILDFIITIAEVEW